MKKLLIVIALFIAASAGHVFAQSAGKVSLQDFHFKTKLVEGLNTVQVPEGRGTLRLTKRGSSFSNVMLVDAAGKVERLSPTDETPGATKPVCPCPMPDACFATENKNIGMCICKACDLTMPENEYSVGLLLPAVQAAREAARRN